MATRKVQYGMTGIARVHRILTRDARLTFKAEATDGVLGPIAASVDLGTLGEVSLALNDVHPECLAVARRAMEAAAIPSVRLSCDLRGEAVVRGQMHHRVDLRFEGTVRGEDVSGMVVEARLPGGDFTRISLHAVKPSDVEAGLTALRARARYCHRAD